MKKNRKKKNQTSINQSINQLEAVALLHSTSGRHSKESFELWKKIYCIQGEYYFVIKTKCQKLYYCFSIPAILVTLEGNIAIWKWSFEDSGCVFATGYLLAPSWGGGQSCL